MNSAGPSSSQLGGDDEQLGVGGARDQRLDAVEHVAAAGAARAVVCSSNGLNSGRGSISASAAAGTSSPTNSGR